MCVVLLNLVYKKAQLSDYKTPAVNALPGDSLL